jgi:hypothetical protein
MSDLHRAMAEIDAIRGHIARNTEFRGYGPAAVATTGAFALAAAALQSQWLPDPQHSLGAYLALWVATAVLSMVLIGIETVTRSVRVHRGLAKEMLHAAAEQFVPAISAGGLLAVVLLRFAPQSLWMLPGLWQLLFSLGVFASCRFLPRPMFAVGLWYLCAGLVCLALGSGPRALSPWMMALPFGVGQLLVAAVLQFSYRDHDD